MYHFFCHGSSTLVFHVTLLHAYMFRVSVLFINVYKLCVNLFERAPMKIGSANWVTIVKLTIITYLLTYLRSMVCTLGVNNHALMKTTGGA